MALFEKKTQFIPNVTYAFSTCMCLPNAFLTCESHDVPSKKRKKFPRKVMNFPSL